MDCAIGHSTPIKESDGRVIGHSTVVGYAIVEIYEGWTKVVKVVPVVELAFVGHRRKFTRVQMPWST